MPKKLTKKNAQLVAQRRVMKKTMSNTKCPDCGKTMNKCTCNK